MVFQNEAGVGLAAEVEASPVSETDPIGRVLHALGRTGKKMAPVEGVGFGKERAIFAVGAGRHDSVGAAEFIAHGGKGATVGVGAWLHPEHSGGAGGECQ